MRRYEVGPEVGSAVLVGVDVHKRQWFVTVRTVEMELFCGSINGDWPSLRSLLGRYDPAHVTVVYEAGFSGFWLHDCVVAWGGQCVVTPPSLVPMEYGNRVKTDKRDSRKLAWLLSLGLLKKVWVPDESQRGHREVLRRRRQLVQDRVRLQSRIKSELALHGISVCDRPGRWSGPLIERLREVRLADAWAQASYERLLEMYDLVSHQLALQTQLLRELSRLPQYRDRVRLLSSVPGIGVITAMALLLELHDVGRFGRAEQLAAYVGLTPSQYSSGDHIRMGRITGMGNSYLRGLLVESAWIAVRRDPHLRLVYERIKQRAGGKRAIVAVARRLVLAVRRVLLDQVAYQPGVAA
jgi:transposase